MTSTENRIKREQLEIDRELASITRERLEFDKAEAFREKKFWRMSAGTRVTILVSGAAVIVSLIVGVFTVWASWITKQKEIQISVIQHQLEQEKLDAQKKREWDLALAQFVVTNQRAIYDGTPQERQILAKIIPTIFPQEVSVTLLERLEKTTSPPARAIWTQAKARVENSNVAQSEERSNQDSKEALNKPPQSGLVALASGPPWFSSAESTKYGSLSLNKGDGGLTTVGNILRWVIPQPTPLNTSGSISPVFSDIVYRPSSALGIINPSFDVNSLSSVPSPTPTLSLTLLDQFGTPEAKSIVGTMTAPEGPTIVGTIIDATSAKSISGATIELESGLTLSRIAVTSDKSGRFSITIPFGTHFVLDPVLRVSNSGYKSTTRQVNVSYSTASIPTSVGSISLQKGTPE